VAADGRWSIARAEAELRPKELPVPIDAWWLRLPRKPDDPAALTPVASSGRFVLVIPREGFLQLAYLARKGSDARFRELGIDWFRREIAAAVPSLADRVDELASMDDVKHLDVRLNRLNRWHVDGLLCIGDAAHAMSPVFGIGINLAVEDAVAAARYLVEPLRAGTVGLGDVRAVQRRRRPTAAATQALQRTAHARVIEPLLAGRPPFGNPGRAQRMAELLTTSRWLKRVPAYFLAYGAVRERPPAAAVR
jgi:2-polyprenyl-6-methoxyphenol hydroxylase-like FAD-dependent oxidoreductase